MLKEPESSENFGTWLYSSREPYLYVEPVFTCERILRPLFKTFLALRETLVPAG